MSFLQPITVAIAGPKMADAVKKDWIRQRDEVLAVINKYRNLLYNLYPTHPLFANIFPCICVSEFCEPCVSRCESNARYFGFTVPAGVAGVEAIFDYGIPLVLRSSWRETFTGIPSDCGGRIDAVRMARQFPTERDLDQVTPLKVRADSKCDEGKTVTVKVLDSDFNERTLDFRLVYDEWQSVADVHAREILSVALPPGRIGEITIAQQNDGKELSVYQPSESSPAYTRFKVPARCSDRRVLIQGNRSFSEVIGDNELVEVGDPLVIEHAGKYFRLTEGTDKGEIQAGEYQLKKMKEQLAGVISRHRGRAMQDGTPARGRACTRSTRLPGYRK